MKPSGDEEKASALEIQAQTLIAVPVDEMTNYTDAPNTGVDQTLRELVASQMHESTQSQDVEENKPVLNKKTKDLATIVEEEEKMSPRASE